MPRDQKVQFPTLPKLWRVGEINLTLTTERGILRVSSEDDGAGPFVTLKTEDAVALDPEELCLLAELGQWLVAMHEGSAA